MAGEIRFWCLIYLPRRWRMQIVLPAIADLSSGIMGVRFGREGPIEVMCHLCKIALGLSSLLGQLWRDVCWKHLTASLGWWHLNQALPDIAPPRRHAGPTSLLFRALVLALYTARFPYRHFEVNLKTMFLIVTPWTAVARVPTCALLLCCSTILSRSATKSPAYSKSSSSQKSSAISFCAALLQKKPQ